MNTNYNKTERLNIRVTKKEKELIEKHANKLGFENNLSTYLRGRILRKDIVLVNPNFLIDELYSLKSELNKIGSNINQIANYSNFLINKSFVDDEFLNKMIETSVQFSRKIHQIEETINKTFDKI